MSARELITDHLDLWTGATTSRSTAGRGRNGKIELTGIKKLRELILELAVRGKLVDQDPSDEPASVLLERIAEEKARLVKDGKIKKPKKLPEIADDEKPFELPVGWQWARLSDVLRVINGRAYKKHEMLQEGTPLLRVGNLFTSNEWYYSDLELEDDKYIDHGDLIYAWSASFGPFIWDGGRAIYHYHIWKLELFDYRSTSKHFLYNYLKAVTEEIKSSGSGIAMIHMTKAKMEELVVPLPPLEEQLRIVEIVDELMALCDRLEQQAGDQLEAHEVLVDTLLDALTRSTDAAEVAESWARIAEHFDTLFTNEASIEKLKQTILQLAVLGRLVEQDPNEEPAPATIAKFSKEKNGRNWSNGSTEKISESFSAPAGWAWTTIDNAVERVTVGFVGSMKHHYKDSGVPFLRTQNVRSNRFSSKGMVYISQEFHEEIKKSSLSPGDVVVVRSGNVGTACVIPESLQEANCSDLVVIKSPKAANPHFLCFYLNSVATSHIKEGSVGIALTHFNTKSVAMLPIALPPLDEQHRIVEKVDELMALCDQLKGRLGEAGDTQTQLATTIVEQVTKEEPCR